MSDTKAAEIEAAWAQHLDSRGDQIRTHRLRCRLAEAQNWRCCYCGCRMEELSGPTRATFEHVVPLSACGLDVVDNLAIACSDCNSKRGRRWYPEHFEALRETGCGLPDWKPSAGWLHPKLMRGRQR